MSVGVKEDLESIMDAAYPVHHYRHIASGHLIKIYEMVHIAPESFFAKRLKQWEEDVAAGFVLHHEGVVGVPADVPLKEGYLQVAEALGWKMQKLPPLPFRNVDVTWEETPQATKLFIKGVSKMVLWLGEKLLADVKEGQEKYADELREKILKNELETKGLLGFALSTFLLQRRNALAVAAALEENSHVSMIWGAAHAEGMGATFLKQGYEKMSPATNNSR